MTGAAGKSGEGSGEAGTGRALPVPAFVRRIQTAFMQGAREVADFIVPPVCLSCNDALTGHDALCGRCWRNVSFIRAPLCDRTGLPLPFDTGGVMVSARALAKPPAYDRARAVAHYDGAMRDLVHGFKYYDRHDARRLFGRWLRDAAEPLLPGADFLIPVPLNRVRLLSRRFNQSALLAKELARHCAVPVEPLALWRTRRTPSQVGKTHEQRRRNVAGAFAVPAAWRERIKGRNILLVDDVITTGATVEACARTLRRAGAARVDVIALALVTDQTINTP